jgi:hypothetical protein
MEAVQQFSGAATPIAQVAMLSSILLSEDPLSPPWRRYGLAVLGCGAVAAALWPFSDRLDLPNTVMCFLLAVVAVAVWAGRGPAVLASVLSVALFDFLFVPPRFSFEVSHAPHVFTFVVMLTVSLIVGQLTAGLRTQARDAARRERVALGLYGLARELAGAVAVGQVDECVGRFSGRNGVPPASLYCRRPMACWCLLVGVSRGNAGLDDDLLRQAYAGSEPLTAVSGPDRGRSITCPGWSDPQSGSAGAGSGRG